VTLATRDTCEGGLPVGTAIVLPLALSRMVVAIKVQSAKLLCRPAPAECREIDLLRKISCLRNPPI